MTIGTGPVTDVPSPNVNVYETIAPSRSVDFVPSNVTASGTAPLLDTVERLALGALTGNIARPCGPGTASIVLTTVWLVRSTIDTVPVAVGSRRWPPADPPGPVMIATPSGSALAAVGAASGRSSR